MEQPIEQVKEEVNYFKKPGLSNSLMSKLNPEEGGSVEAFIEALEGNAEELDSKYVENGKMVHLYAEHPENFEFSDVDAPSEMNQQWVEYVHANLPEELPTENVSIEGLKPGTAFNATPFQAYVIAIKTGLNLHSNIKDPAKIAEKWNNECEAYYQFLKRADGKICLSKSQKADIDHCIEAIKRNPKAAVILDEKAEGWIVFKELELAGSIKFIEKPTGRTGSNPIKGKLDNVWVNFETKEVIIRDLKTVSFPLAYYPDKFKSRFTHRQLALYAELMGQFLKENYNIDPSEIKVSVEIVAVSTKEKRAIVFQAANSVLREGQMALQSALNRYQYHVRENNWSMSMEELENDGYMPLRDERDHSDILSRIIGRR